MDNAIVFWEEFVVLIIADIDSTVGSECCFAYVDNQNSAIKSSTVAEVDGCKHAFFHFAIMATKNCGTKKSLPPNLMNLCIANINHPFVEILATATVHEDSDAQDIGIRICCGYLHEIVVVDTGEGGFCWDKRRANKIDAVRLTVRKRCWWSVCACFVVINVRTVKDVFVACWQRCTHCCFLLAHFNDVPSSINGFPANL